MAVVCGPPYQLCRCICNRMSLLFPGQGFQRPGMLKKYAQDFPKIVQPILRKIDLVMPELNLSKVLATDSERVNDKLLIQPLLLASGYAKFQVWKSLNPESRPKFGIGHSLGEYTALTCANVLSLEEALKLVYLRGIYTSQADDSNGMIMVKARNVFTPQLIAKLEPYIGTYNATNQLVLTGKLDTLRKVISKQLPRQTFVNQLKVPNAFHSEAMAESAASFEKAVNAMDFNKLESAEFQLISNVDAKPVESLDKLKRNLVESLTKPVLWHQCLSTALTLGSTEFTAFDEKMPKIIDKRFHKYLHTF